MQKIKIVLILSLLFSALYSFGQGWDRNLVDIFTNQPYNGDHFDYIVMKREGNRVKTKYFARNYTSVEADYNQFAKGKGIVCYAAAGYLTGNFDRVENLTIVNVNILERNIPKDRFDALVIIYASGGVVVSDLRRGNLKLQGGNAPDRPLDIRNNSFDRQIF